jgi:hypothetical protein
MSTIDKGLSFFAKFAGYVYEFTTKPKESYFIYNDWFIDRQITDLLINNEGFVMYNNVTREVVFSLKGTNILDKYDLIHDASIFFTGSPVDIMRYELVLETIINKYKDKQRKINYKIFMSSHSLGASKQYELLTKKRPNGEYFLEYIGAVYFYNIGITSLTNIPSSLLLGFIGKDTFNFKICIEKPELCQKMKSKIRLVRIQGDLVSAGVYYTRSDSIATIIDVPSAWTISSRHSIEEFINEFRIKGLELEKTLDIDKMSKSEKINYRETLEKIIRNTEDDLENTKDPHEISRLKNIIDETTIILNNLLISINIDMSKQKENAGTTSQILTNVPPYEQEELVKRQQEQTKKSYENYINQNFPNFVRLKKLNTFIEEEYIKKYNELSEKIKNEEKNKNFQGINFEVDKYILDRLTPGTNEHNQRRIIVDNRETEYLSSEGLLSLYEDELSRLDLNYAYDRAQLLRTQKEKEYYEKYITSQPDKLGDMEALLDKQLEQEREIKQRQQEKLVRDIRSKLGNMQGEELVKAGEQLKKDFDTTLTLSTTPEELQKKSADFRKETVFEVPVQPVIQSELESRKIQQDEIAKEAGIKMINLDPSITTNIDLIQKKEEEELKRKIQTNRAGINIISNNDIMEDRRKRFENISRFSKAPIIKKEKIKRTLPDGRIVEQEIETTTQVTKLDDKIPVKFDKTPQKVVNTDIGKKMPDTKIKLGKANKQIKEVISKETEKPAKLKALPDQKLKTLKQPKEPKQMKRLTAPQKIMVPKEKEEMYEIKNSNL